jgi:tRNA/rRNA methyltransferase
MSLAAIRIVLVEPAGPLNVGSIARVMKNFDLHQLVLVNPQCDPLGEEARQMAVHGLDILEAAQQVPSLTEALAGCQRAIATTARPRDFDAPLELPETALPWLLPPPNTPVNTTGSGQTGAWQTALLFGPEERGLSNVELNCAQRFVCIPSSATYPSLNLAQSVAVCAYVLSRSAADIQAQSQNQSQGESGFALRSQPSAPPISSQPEASLENLAGFSQHLEALLLKIGYLYPHTATSRMEKFRRLLNRTGLSEAELALLRGVLRQMEWALNQPTLPPNANQNPAPTSPTPQNPPSNSQ